jgi:tungstate transport system substrate-binding protein
MTGVRPAGALLAAALALAGPSCSERPARTLDLATTTSVVHSGLLDALLPAFESETSITVRVHQAGSGRALVMLAEGRADLVISHAPDAEARALRQSPGWWYRKIMYNDFLIAGPSSDPAGAAQAESAAAAMRRIAASGALFVSRGDESGTHERERALWTAAGDQPAPGRLVAAGQGMGGTLRVASAMNGYTLTDRATFAQLVESLHLAVVFEDDPLLLNTYAVLVATDPGRRAADDAMRFGRWLAEGNGRALIEGYRLRTGIPGFHVWPADRPRTGPADLPK